MVDISSGASAILAKLNFLPKAPLLGELSSECETERFWRRTASKVIIVIATKSTPHMAVKGALGKFSYSG